MPAIARYDSWKPTEVMADGLRTSWISRAVDRIRSGFRGRQASRAVSVRKMNRKARTMEGEAPVIKVNRPAARTVSA